MNTPVRLPLTLLTLLALPLASQCCAQTVSPTLNFDDVQPGTVINTTYDAQYHVTFTGTTSNPLNNGVQVIDVVSLSAPNALDTTNSAVRVSFSTVFYAQGISTFGINLLADPQGYGSTNTTLQFFDKNGVSLGTLAVDETVNRLLNFSAAGIQSVLLPADAYFDNLRFTGRLTAPVAVPEPGMVTLLGAGLLAAGGLSLRRKSRTTRRA